METSNPAPGHLHDLSADECWSLAATRPVGRIAWNGGDGVTVIPVNFTVDGHAVHIRTAAYSALARECDDSPVAFQVDEFDGDTRSGWSVLMRGRAHIDFDSPGQANAADVWPGGSHGLQLNVDVAQVSGRRVQSQG
jgi:nitroimidazol reductase NimA-like FMN-containing flavoprotein (pyridoxamine 5'-phosphate oxidase superfamily)